jgi:H+/gluconate symporter-like permease
MPGPFAFVHKAWAGPAGRSPLCCGAEKGQPVTILPILLALGLLIWGAYRGLSVLLLAPLLAVAAAVVSGGPALGSYTQVFMVAAGGFVVSFFPLFLLGAVFGRIMDDSGATTTLARTIAARVGRDRAILSVVLACAVLTYGGVSLFVVAFAAWPLARALFAETDTPARLIPATIALGAFTFTMTALPGTPAIQNAIPMPWFGTTAFAAPGLGVLTGLVMLGLGQAWLVWRARRMRAAGEGFGLDSGAPAPDAARAIPVWQAVMPIFAVVSLTWVLGAHVLPSLDTTYLLTPRYGATDLGRVLGLWSVIGALTLSCGLALVFGWTRLTAPADTLDQGARAALLPIFNTASLVGFGAVIAALPGFEAIRLMLEGATGGSVLWSLALVVNVLAGITGSASGGMSIALEAFGPQYLEQARAAGIDPALLHRVTSVATGGLDALPHNGAVITLLGICGMTHARAYGDIFVVAVAIPVLALVVLILAGTTFGTF